MAPNTNVVSFEIAKKLDAAGWPTDPDMFWCPDLGELTYSPNCEPYEKRKCADHYPAPNAQEIADQIGPELKLYFPKSHWFACDAANKSTIAQHVGEGETMAEALASLWLNSQEGQE